MEQKFREIEFAETKVYVKEIYKKMDAISITLESMKSYSGKSGRSFLKKFYGRL